MNKQVAIIGGGPAGLMAAEVIASAGHKVAIYDRMPSLARKFLMAGRGGLNITHSEELEEFINRYGEAAGFIAPHIKAFTPADLRQWCEGLGEKTFIGSSGRVFPVSMKAAPLLRAWLKRLESLGVTYHPRHNWLGWKNGALKFANSAGEILVSADATILALGGASWPRLGSDGSWVDILKKHGVEIAPLRPANCGFNVLWSEYFAGRFAGMPLKPVAISYADITRQGEVMITAKGIEGGAVYAISAKLREALEGNGQITIQLDLRPDMKLEVLENKLSRRGKDSFSNYLRKSGFSALAIALLRECGGGNINLLSAAELAKLVKNMPLVLTGMSGLERAISTAGGIRFEALDNNFMLKNMPGVFATGEMLDWEAPTGGYLLQACFALSRAAAKGCLEFIER